MTRRVVLHAGLHKTGTTSLQSFLFGAGEALRRNGFIYPRAGGFEWLGGGQHNIAWQLAGDRRFEPRSGTVDDVAREIGGAGLDAVLSAEDFESILDAPERFAPLCDHPALRDREFVLVIYVRNQASYLESLYLEMLHHGVGAGLAEFSAPIFATGKIVFHEWAFQFDYADMHARLAAWGRMKIVLRNYHRMDAGSVIADFLNQVCPAMTADAGRPPEWANPRDAIADSLRMFFGNRRGRKPSPFESETLARIADHVGGRPVVLSAGWRNRLAQRFAQPNRQLCVAAGVDPAGLTEMPPPDADSVALENLFRPDTIDAIATTLAGELDAGRLDALLGAIPPA